VPNYSESFRPQSAERPQPPRDRGDDNRDIVNMHPNRKSSLFLYGGCAILAAWVASAAAQTPSIGDRFASGLEAANTRTFLKRLSARPHHTGSAGGLAVAEYIAGQFRSWGFETGIETLYALIPTPVENRVELLEPVRYRAALSEPFIPGFTPEHTEGSLPPFSAYSADGDVTAAAVYVNYGLPEDYRRLEAAGIDVSGKIVVARFGETYRGVKPRVAHQQGALGIILFSDPAEYGYARGLEYPEGRFLPAFGYQRGSVLNLPRRTGDPLTPGVGAVEKVTGFSPDDAADVIAPIPVIPLSARDIQPILEAMAGPAAPPEWQGALPLTYRYGGAVKIRMTVKQDWAYVPLHNVVARLQGSRWPEEWILRGNNHDAWNYGAEDALSGLAAMMEEARGVAALTRTGWRPGRTLVYIAWDGEEYGLLGSTEWAEAHARELADKAVLYVNSGPVTPGYFHAGGSHALESLVNSVARIVRDPRFDATLFERVAANIHVHGSQEQKADLELAGRMRLEPLGVGSDWTPFLQHLGIASLYIGFEGEIDNGVYHSVYDTFELYDRLGDRAYDYLARLAEAGGRTVLQLADADVLPFDFSGMAHAVAGYVRELEDLVQQMEIDRRENAEAIERGWLRLAGMSERAAPGAADRAEIPNLDFAPLEAAVVRLQESAERYLALRGPFEARAGTADADRLRQLNTILFRAERALTSETGLPGRPWYRHLIYAPGTDTGYAPKTLPGIREAIEARRWQTAHGEIGRVAASLHAYAAEIEKACALMETPQ